MGTVHNFQRGLGSGLESTNKNYHDDGNGGGGDDGMLEKRVEKLENTMSELRTDIAVIKSNYATKEDIAAVRIEVHQAIANQTKWLAASMLGITAAALAVAKLIF